MLIPVSIKTLAEFVHRQGDLYPRLGGRVTGEEGISMQRLAQQNRGAGYEREVSVAGEFVWDDLTLVLTGRMDGCDLTAEPPLVEEIKTTRAAPADAERLVGSAHWAQATLYAALLARSHTEIDSWRIRLLYCHPDTEQTAPFDRTRTSVELDTFLADTIARYGRWLAAQMAYRTGRDHWLKELSFPYGAFRPHQRALSGRVYQAFREREHLLLEAPTGSGKTMGVLFPALKALASGLTGRLFYLTSRGTGAIAPLQACADMASSDRRIRVVDLLAKQKACLVPGMPCDDRCEYAVGYYDRIEAALQAVLDVGQMTGAAVRTVAQAHRVCPFELSLDAALWADLVIGDYNYLLDPVVRLQRFAADGSLGVLIDESHQLADRARDMLSLSLMRSELRSALKESPPAVLARRLKGVDRALLKLRRELLGQHLEPLLEHVIAEPVSLLGAMQRALDALADETVDLAELSVTRLLMFNLSRWIRAAAWTDPERFRFLARVDDHGGGIKDLQVRLVCLDPSAYLAETLSGYGPHVRFSGTVSPLALYQSLHGQPDEPAERVASPFAAEQMATLIVGDLPVYYRQRERTLPALTDLIADVCAAAAGNYLVALPSFDYLERLHASLSERHPNLVSEAQQPGMSEAARTEFLAGFRADSTTRLGLIVLGGVFGESVDFSHAPLAGVICVGVGMPPSSRLREEMARHFDAALGTGAGETVAFQQPAMTKVLQMAGRLLRSPEDRGILCLIDDRFARVEYQRFFPRHWRPEGINRADVSARLVNFWQTVPRLPRLRTPAEASSAVAPEPQPGSPK